MDAQAVTIAGVALPVIIVAVVSLVRRAGVPSRWAPVAAVVSGMLAGVAARYLGDTDGSLTFFLVTGFMEGLAAAGLYSGVKAVAKKK